MLTNGKILQGFSGVRYAIKFKIYSIYSEGLTKLAALGVI